MTDSLNYLGDCWFNPEGPERYRLAVFIDAQRKLQVTPYDPEGWYAPCPRCDEGIIAQHVTAEDCIAALKDRLAQARGAVSQCAVCGRALIKTGEGENERKIHLDGTPECSV